MGAIAGLRGTGDWGTDERPKDFRESILFYNPNGTAPIFALTGKAGKKTVTDPQFFWWSEPNTLWRGVVNGALLSTDTTVTLTASDPTNTTPGALWSAASHLKQGDLLMVEPTVDVPGFANEIIQVDTALSDTQFTALRGAGGSTAAAIGNGVGLSLIGSAFAEGTGAPRAVSRNPIKYTNFTQIFKDTYELTGTVTETFARTGDPWSNDKKRKMFDHARAIEEAILYGLPSETTGGNGKPLRTMGGLRNFIPTTVGANSAITNTTVWTSGGMVSTNTPPTPTTVFSILDAIEPVFDIDTEGGDTRIVFAGNQAIVELNKILQASTNLRINFSQEIKVYGLDFKELILPRGRLLIRSHPLLSRHPLYKRSAFVLDFASVKYVALKGRDTRTRDDVQLKDEDVRRGFVQTEASLMVDRGGLTCAYLGNISAT
jgi:hypothetical protein